MKRIYETARAMVHSTVTITEADVRAFYPCDDGIKNAVETGLFPMVISTDPEANIELALTIADAQRAHDACDDVWWLLSKVAADRHVYGVAGPYISPFTLFSSDVISKYASTDATLGMQALAALADVLDCEARRKARRKAKRRRAS